VHTGGGLSTEVPGRRLVGSSESDVFSRGRLGSFFEGAVHLLEPAPRAVVQAAGEQRDKQTLELFYTRNGTI
jgi:hypothetical protein